ncbi:hypothetical protein GCM10010156_30470 [Planobispora rosea]|uniref:Uncharacterized protein n=1 Tax=Planobispora rosea TaxID=35762 RepID=A0A8J3RYW5_PLARO|nr:DUF2809 domain-containing protein [Planobispora rosea]GGS69606.1 hypothetical protein GCM10010156_30470 [Planobispora rosea]GIH83155.1 hypothetical protein Pro02_15630 [Planobispora rosea]
MPPALRSRIPAALAALATVAAGLSLRAATDGWLGKYGGDALYTVLIYTLIVFVRPRVTPVRAAAGALAFSWAVEFAQLTPLPAALSEASTLARLVLGSTFGAADLVAYAAGAVLAAVAHLPLRRTPAVAPPPVGRTPFPTEETG